MVSKGVYHWKDVLGVFEGTKAKSTATLKQTEEKGGLDQRDPRNTARPEDAFEAAPGHRRGGFVGAKGSVCWGKMGEEGHQKANTEGNIGEGSFFFGGGWGRYFVGVFLWRGGGGRGGGRVA